MFHFHNDIINTEWQVKACTKILYQYEYYLISNDHACVRVTFVQTEGNKRKKIIDRCLLGSYHCIQTTHNFHFSDGKSWVWVVNHACIKINETPGDLLGRKQIMIMAIKSNLGRVCSFHKQIIKTFNFSREILITVSSFCLSPERTLWPCLYPTWKPRELWWCNYTGTTMIKVVQYLVSQFKLGNSEENFESTFGELIFIVL